MAAKRTVLLLVTMTMTVPIANHFQPTSWKIPAIAAVIELELELELELPLQVQLDRECKR